MIKAKKSSKNRKDEEPKKLRRNCKHLKLLELISKPTSRICMNCGAEERGGGYGYQVLVVSTDKSKAPYKKERKIVKRTKRVSVFYTFRKGGLLHFVGQSHPDFKPVIKKYYK